MLRELTDAYMYINDIGDSPLEEIFWKIKNK